MIQTNTSSKETLKQMRDKEQKEKDLALKAKCESFASDRYGAEQVVTWSNQNKGLWFLPCLDEDENIEKLGILKPIDRHILGRAADKLEEGGLYVFLEACMRECWVEGDQEILEDDEYFIPSALKFNKILDGKKMAFLKR